MEKYKNLHIFFLRTFRTFGVYLGAFLRMFPICICFWFLCNLHPPLGFWQSFSSMFWNQPRQPMNEHRGVQCVLNWDWVVLHVGVGMQWAAWEPSDLAAVLGGIRSGVDVEELKHISDAWSREREAIVWNTTTQGSPEFQTGFMSDRTMALLKCCRYQSRSCHFVRFFTPARL